VWNNPLKFVDPDGYDGRFVQWIKNLFSNKQTDCYSFGDIKVNDRNHRGEAGRNGNFGKAFGGWLKGFFGTGEGGVSLHQTNGYNAPRSIAITGFAMNQSSFNFGGSYFSSESYDPLDHALAQGPPVGSTQNGGRGAESESSTPPERFPQIQIQPAGITPVYAELFFLPLPKLGIFNWVKSGYRTFFATKGVTNLIPEGKLANHLFKGAGKLADTPANRTLIEKISNGKPLGVDQYGKAWYIGVDAAGKPIYSYTQNGVVKGAGYMNMTPAEMITKYGLK
jgi:hypothetical protein